MEGMRSNLGPKQRHNIKNGSFCSYVRCTTYLFRVGEMPWPKTGAPHYNAQLRLLDKGHAIKVLIVSWVLLNLIPWA